MRGNKVVVGASLVLALMAGGSSAQAWDFSITTTGAKASTGDDRRVAKIADTSADKRLAFNRYQRGSASAASQVVKTTGGSTSSASSASSSTRVATIQACTDNLTPFNESCSVKDTS